MYRKLEEARAFERTCYSKCVALNRFTFDMFSPNLSTALAALPLLYACYWVLFKKLNRSRLPPGPSGWPVIGNLLDMPTSTEWVKYRDLGKEYGACFQLCSSQFDVYSDNPLLYRFRYRIPQRAGKSHHRHQFSGGSPRSAGGAFIDLLKQVSHQS